MAEVEPVRDATGVVTGPGWRQRQSQAEEINDSARPVPAGGAPVQCTWFALCDRPATHMEPHPAFPLGGVPCCDRCAEVGR